MDIKLELTHRQTVVTVIIHGNDQHEKPSFSTLFTSRSAGVRLLVV